MKLNWAEKTVTNNPVRAWIQRHYEAAMLDQLGGRLDGGRALEVGCGRGIGIEIIRKRFGAERIHAFDIDPNMVARAKRRLDGRIPGLRLYVGDATAIDERDAYFDAVFDFGIIHHVPDWRAAVQEIRRVLRPGGRFYFQEFTRHALERRTFRKLFEHPTDDRFSAEEFVAALEREGLTVGDRYRTRFFDNVVLGVAERATEGSRPGVQEDFAARVSGLTLVAPLGRIQR